MITVIKDLPDNVIGMKATDVLTQSDYKKILLPLVEEKLKNNNTLKLLSVIDKKFDHITFRAMIEDTKVAFKNWNDFSHIAIVTDLEWMKIVVLFFEPIIKAKIQIFPLDDYSSAEKWICE